MEEEFIVEEITFTEMHVLAYELKDETLREFSIYFGIWEIVKLLVRFYISELGFYGTKQIDRAYIHSLCEHDKDSLKRVAKWLYNVPEYNDDLSIVMNF